LPRTPQTPVPLVAQETSPEPEQVPAPIQGIRREVSAGTQLCYLLSINHSKFGNPSLSGSNFTTTKLFIYGE
jgi:hypothetical protein